MNDNTLFFHKYSFDKEGNPLKSFICKTACIEREGITLNGITGKMRSAESADSHFVLCVITGDDDKAIDPRKFNLKKDQPVPGIMDTGKKVSEDSTLTWGCSTGKPAVKE
tara:strand:+ start:157 stop:486 length:330 start_codon:yes stop_codon:yes gene_type:complete